MLLQMERHFLAGFQTEQRMRNGNVVASHGTMKCVQNDVVLLWSHYHTGTSRNVVIKKCQVLETWRTSKTDNLHASWTLMRKSILCFFFIVIPIQCVLFLFAPHKRMLQMRNAAVWRGFCSSAASVGDEEQLLRALHHLSCLEPQNEECRHRLHRAQLRGRTGPTRSTPRQRAERASSVCAIRGPGLLPSEPTADTPPCCRGRRETFPSPTSRDTSQGAGFRCNSRSSGSTEQVCGVELDLCVMFGLVRVCHNTVCATDELQTPRRGVAPRPERTSLPGHWTGVALVAV